MRKITFFALLITGAGVLALLPAVIDGQQPGGRGFGGKGGGGFGGFGGGGPGGGINPGQDPDVLYDVYAKGRSYITLDDVARSRLSGPLSQYVQEKGLNGNLITRQNFKDFFAYANSKAGVAPPQGPPGGGFGPGGFGPGGFGGKKKGFGGGDSGAMPGTMDVDKLSEWADMEFKRLDKNGDGKLNAEEMGPWLQRSLDKWDKNNDGLLDMAEYRAYFIAKMQGNEDAGGRGNKGIAAIIIDEEDLDRKPVVYRAGGKQPPGLPDWFNKLDTDKDGQVALYEWRTANKNMDEFRTWDLNDDGFITMDEAAKVNNIMLAKKGGGGNGTEDSLASADPGEGGRPAFGKKGPGGGMFPGMGGKKNQGGDGTMQRPGGDGTGTSWPQRGNGDGKGKGGFGKKKNSDNSGGM